MTSPMPREELPSDVRWACVNDEPFEYAIQQGPHGDEFVELLNGTCLRRSRPPQQTPAPLQASHNSGERDPSVMTDCRAGELPLPWTVRGEFTTGDHAGWLSIGRGKCEAIFRDFETVGEFVDALATGVAQGSGRGMSERRIWAPEQIAVREQDLEARVASAQRELDAARAWRRSEMSELRKFRVAKAKYEAAHSLQDRGQP